MTDIVERLHGALVGTDPIAHPATNVRIVTVGTITDAAAEIERLRRIEFAFDMMKMDCDAAFVQNEQLHYLLKQARRVLVMNCTNNSDGLTITDIRELAERMDAVLGETEAKP